MFVLKFNAYLCLFVILSLSSTFSTPPSLSLPLCVCVQCICLTLRGL